MASTRSLVNSTTGILASGGTFDGAAVDVSNYSSVFVSAYSVGTNGTLQLEQSSNGTDWDIVDTAVVTAAASVTNATNLFSRFYRTQFVNGAGTQTALRIQTRFNTGTVSDHSTGGSTVIWSGGATNANDNGATHNINNGPHLSFIGNVSALTTLTVYLSNDGVVWYKDINSYGASGSEDIAIHLTTGAGFATLQSSVNVTATIIAASK